MRLACSVLRQSTSCGRSALPRPRGWRPHLRAGFHTSAVARAEKQDLYALLGVPRTADATEIKKAYYRAAKEHHPDRNKSKESEKMFAAINSAYEVLKDEERRARYDRTGIADTNAAEMEERRQAEEEMMMRMQDAFGGFGGLFGGMNQSRAASTRGADLEISIQLTFMEAVKGVDRLVTYNAMVPCTTCDGSGSKDKTAPTKCPRCRGTGVRLGQQGNMMFQLPCDACQSMGVVVANPCQTCRSSGVVKGRSELSVKVPPGVDEATTIRIARKGHSGIRKGEPGNLLITCRVAEHDFFQRDGSDVHVAIPLKLSQALLGGKITVPSLDGNMEIELEAGTQPGDEKPMRGKGIESLKKGMRGNLVLHFRVDLPKTLTERQKQLIQEFDGESSKAEAASGDDKSAKARKKPSKLFSKDKDSKS